MASSSSTSVRCARTTRSTTAGCARAGPCRRRSRRERAKKRTRWSQILGASNQDAQPVVREPVLRRLTDSEAALVEAADLFNASLFRRTIEGVAKALGAPLVSIVPLSGVNSELVLTFAWEITWYQYRVLPEAGQPIRLADRGADLSEIEAAFTEWNARLDDDGRVVPDVAR